MKIIRNAALVVAISLGLVLLGVKVHSNSTDILALATISHSQLFDAPAAVTVRILTLKPGEALPWHYHPGYAFNSIKSGTLTVEDGCGQVQTLTSGQGFEEIEGRVHRATNLGTTDVLVYNTFITVKDKPTMMRVAGDERRCGPPLTTGECQTGGWQKFTHPQNFADEGRCLAFVRAHEARSKVFKSSDSTVEKK